ncbi:uncharacterized protein LOC126812504 [Patella vulgata]|uniref:uncharacterized protein LOC126812504 n=1 Tax=Patella vulgata TaxID=6465 RepID=UPI0021802345|nr:uncharacterized protein LOC126812504 [Patella vulgata]
MEIRIVACFVICAFIMVTYADFPFNNPSLPWDQRVDDLVGRLTLDEIKLQMSKGGSGPHASPAPAIRHLGIGPYSWDTECLRGDAVAGNATSFPQAIGLAASFSPDLIYRVAEATSIEVRAKYNDYNRRKIYGDHKGVSCFSPVINIVRDPRWGRIQETYGEDPYLSGVLASYFVKGLQGNNTRYIRANAGCKHFDVHGGPENIPVSRFSFNAQVSERDWRTTFLPQFKACVDAGTYSLMCSFNRINGVPACANKKLLTDILRNEWNFTGYVISDQEAVENIITYHHYLNNSIDTAALCINAGLNLELSTNEVKPVYFAMEEAIQQGKLTEDMVRSRVKPLFYTRMRLGEFDPPSMNPYTKLDLSVVQSKAHQALALEAAIKSFVLLKNDEQFLPRKYLNSVAVVGPMANNIKQQFGDYSPDINPTVTTTPLQAFQNVASNVKYAAGCQDNTCTQYSSLQIQQAIKGVDGVYVCLGTGQEIESEGNDRSDLELPGHQLDLLLDVVKFANGKPVVLVLFNAGPLNISMIDTMTQVPAIIACFFPAQATGDALIDILLNRNGAVPSARLPVTWPMTMDQVPPITNYTMVGRTYRYSNGVPLYPFGYGLSYTRFSYSNLKIPTSIMAGMDLTGSVDISNIGGMAAEEVYQIYIVWAKAAVPVPRSQLADFNRVELGVDQTVTVKFRVKVETMAVWIDSKGWKVESGPMKLYVGGQQPNQKKSTGSNILSSTFNIKHSIFTRKR